MALVRGLDPIASVDACVLVLGTMPGAASLASSEYYRHPRNAFWKLVEAIFEIPSTLDYESRLGRLRAARVALWDVLKLCEREGSLDADILAPVPNDFAAFYERHPAITRVYFNGAKAEQLYNRHVPRSPRSMELTCLPSTSPANTAAFAVKLAHWRAIRP